MLTSSRLHIHSDHSLTFSFLQLLSIGSMTRVRPQEMPQEDRNSEEDVKDPVRPRKKTKGAKTTVPKRRCIELVEYLKHKLELWYVGTARVNRVGCAPLMFTKEMDKKAVPRGKYDYYSSNGIFALRWKDDETVTLLSSDVGFQPVQNVKRRWYLQLFGYALDLCVCNAWVLYKCDCKVLEEKPMARNFFRLNIIHFACCHKAMMSRRAQHPPIQSRYDTSKPHIPTFAINCQTCKYCSTKTDVHRSSWMCDA
ncbi:hypothetical protein E2C01_058944 [Portunus trituberculatus]|uniref:PiggyBac transposable element-derived protein domain-containing protein n=1 Tax=Portunus trituberculatus TaxID=210409 RepID=A0A5B7H431_PORTR|nr:hypothetical protein [Portunus trituberculatus]